MSNIKDVQQIQSLIAKGKGTGFLTFDEVNKALPVEMSTPEQFEEIIGIFDQLEIVIVDSEKDGKKISVSTADAYRGIVPRIPAVPLKEILRQPVETWRDMLTNDFEETVFAKYPALAAIKRSLYDSGAVYASMSGSGSALIALYPR